MFKLTVIFLTLTTILIFMVIMNEGKKKGKRKTKFGPKTMSFNHSTTCDEFAKNARFNPYSVLFERWFVFYYWALPQTLKTYLFTFPSSNLTKKLHLIFDGKVTKPVNWTSRLVLMEGPGDDVSLLVERGDRGQYWQYFIHKVDKELIEPYDVRLKQTGDGKLLGIMNCNLETVFVMSRINEVPPKERLHEEAARLGYRARRGKSYLYQGHEWMPIPEADDIDIWERPDETFTINQILDSESKHLKNLIKEELDKYPSNSESNNKLESKDKFNESYCKNNTDICQSVHKITETKHNDSKNNLEAHVFNNNTTVTLPIENKQENQHSSKHMHLTYNFQEQELINNVEGIQFTNINTPLQPNLDIFESKSEIQTKELTNDTANQFTDRYLNPDPIVEVEQEINDLEIMNKPALNSDALLPKDTMQKDDMSDNKNKYQSAEILKYSDANNDLQSIDDIPITDTDDPNSLFDPSEIIDLESNLNIKDKKI